ncbi:MAG: hypothetical protein VZR54_01985 [Ruminococcus sp.]|nr:hypothetical protein [Ruminococcus sp.]
MKKSFNIKSKLGRKNAILSLVALILIMLTFVSVSYSWIEEVSNVELTSNDDAQQTPLHISNKKLDSDVEIINDTQHSVIDLNSYFYRSGDMHLSACYSNGTDFKFPFSGSSTSNYRDGTKDDANTNYLSTTFRVKSVGAATSYWFEKISGKDNFFYKQNYTNATDPDTKERVVSNTQSADSNVEQYIRASITVNGATTVYAFNNTGEYKTAYNTTCADEDKKSVRDYMYYDESFYNSNPLGSYKRSSNPDNKTNKFNQGSGDNLNGNTLFTVGKDKTVTVTVKIWLEKGASVNSIDFSNINLQLTSSWAKTRRIYVRDMTVNEYDSGLGQTGTKWLGNSNGKLYWAIKDDSVSGGIIHFDAMTSYGNGIYYINIPAVYNGMECILYRCNNAWSVGNHTDSNGVSYWDKWENTAFPNTFHSETFSVFSHKYATWEEVTNTVYVIDSADFIGQGKKVMSYMWDSNSEHGTGVNDKVVRNADWPGKEMTRLYATANSGMKTYALFFSSAYDRAVFNDGDVVSGANQEYQTQNLWLTSNEMNRTFDMATLTWFHTKPGDSDWNSKIPTYSSSNTYLWSNISTNNKWKKTYFAYDGEYDTSSYGDNAFKNTNSGNMLCKIYNKANVGNNASDYEFKIYYNGTWYGAYNDGDKRIYPGGSSYTLGSDANHTSNLILKDLKNKTVYRVYMTFDNGNPKVSIAEGEALAQ